MPNNVSWLLAPALGLALAGCDLMSTATPSDDDVLDAPLPGLTGQEMAAFVRGDQEFGRRFSPATGLGPIFNNASCASCHSGDGRGLPSNILVRIGTRDDGFRRDVGGPQIQDKAIAGANAEPIPVGVALSRRLPPPVFGVGLIEAVPDATILAHADPDDRDGDGISGRPNWVTPPPYLASRTALLGRFSRKAQVSSLLEQVVEAYHQDIGITSDFRFEENPDPFSGIPVAALDIAPDPEVPAATVQAVVHYIRTLAPPAPGEITDRRQRGQQLFAGIGCASCHVPVLRTGHSPIGAIANRDVILYSDLLLHDMGEELADHRADGDATGREWRTTPLWGLRVMRDFLAGRAFLMHDGRAATVAEAILLHGGEAAGARNRFATLSAAERGALLDFVESR